MDDTNKRKPWTLADGRTIRLRPMEARVLSYLQLHQGQIVSMKELLRNVWGYDTAARSRTVYTTINRLRTAIEVDPHRPQLLVTVPGGGFRLGPAGAPRASPRSLPRQIDLFVERPEAAAAADLLQAGHRLVTLTGIGGIGKTRTALEVARRVEATFGGGTEFVDLAGCSGLDAAHVRIARDLGLDTSGATPHDAIARALGARPGAVVVLDNVEGVARDLAPLLRDALREPCGAALLVTSRSPVGVRGEKVVPIGPLSVLALPGSSTSPAATLFIDRVSTSGVEIDPEQVDAVVRMLGGLPLAIEFAAARARAVPMETLREQLSAGVADLTRPLGSDARHSSVDAAIEESWTCLDGSLRDAMTSLGVLGGSFSFGLAEAVLPPDAADTLQRLVRAGMLQFDGSSYRVLTPVSDFITRRGRPPDAVWDRLDDFLSGIPLADVWDRRATERRHLHAVAHLLPDAWVRAWKGGSPHKARALLRRTYVSREWLGQPGPETSALADEVIATAQPGERARIVLDRASFCLREVAQQLDQAIEWARVACDSDTEAYARSFRGTVNGSLDAGELQALEPRPSMASAVRIVLMTRRYHQAVADSTLLPAERLPLIEAAVALSKVALDSDLELHPELMLAHAYALGECAQYERAVGVIEELEHWLAKAASDPASEFTGASSRLATRYATGDVDGAERLVAQLMGRSRQCGSAVLMASSLGYVARLSAERGEIETALAFWRQAEGDLARYGGKGNRLMVLVDMARAALHAGRVEEARATLDDTLFGWPLGFVVFWRDLMLLRCDLADAFESVDGVRVDALVARASTRGPSPLAWAQGMRAWWLAGNGEVTRAGVALDDAWAALGPAQGMQRREIERIERTVREIGSG